MSAFVALCVAGLMPAIAWAQEKPGAPIDQRELCLGCHDLGGARVTHAPVEAGDCSACHNPHVARHEKLLRRRPGPLCASCHDVVRERLEKATIHPPVLEERCGSCHRPHGSDHRGLLAEGEERLCLACHDEIGEWQDRAVQHAPFAGGDCGTCHDAHASDAPHLLRAKGAALCTSCHDAASLRRSHGGRPLESSDCQQCHEPHASAQKGLFRETVHAPFEAGDCATCHAGTGAGKPFATSAPLDELCGACHEETVEAARGAAFPHVAGGGSACTACHNPHTGDGALLARPPESLCLSCHDPGGASSGEKGRHVTHSGFPCTTCHEAHGGSRPLLFTDDVTELCGSCHSHQHGVRHPQGEDTRDPRTGNPMDCRSCHGIHRADGEKYLFEEDLRMLCVGCHKEMVGR